MDIWVEFANSRYGYISSLVPNSMLLVYTTWKVVQLCRRRGLRSADKLYGQHRFVVFILMLINLIIKCVYDVKSLYYYYTRTAEEETSMYIFSVLSQFRTILIITVATYFAQSWHRSYTLFEENEQSKRTHRMYRVGMFFINLLAYLSLILTPMYWVYDDLELLAIMFGIFGIDLLIVTIALAITGRKFYQRVLNLLTYTGRSVKSSKRFLKIYYLIIICCLMKCIEMGMITVLTWDGGFASQTLYYIYDIMSLFVFRAFIEPLFYLCLIFLLNESASKCKSVISEDVTSDHFIQDSSRSQSQSLDIF
ncbi:MAG: hypothetical protein EOO43_19975 [Flavobacterium sp.]|nr:MAG: hypothetical protein EOO43_19975 [Flavobacterium sp.]